MAKDSVPQELEKLNKLRTHGKSDPGISALRKALGYKSNSVVAKAAQIAGEWQAGTLLPDLLACFEHMLVDGVKRDPQCLAKNQLAKAIKDLAHREAKTFRLGLRYEQWEAIWGGQTDTAPVLRGSCALALASCDDIPRQEILLDLVDAATEANAHVRFDATAALEQMGGLEVSLLLRMKARTGDTEPRVSGQVFESILALEREGGVEFVAEFLRKGERETAEEAALALGTARLEGALDCLIKEAAGRQRFVTADLLLRAISASRLDRALDFLIDKVEQADEMEAKAALAALNLHHGSAEIVERIGRAVGERSELRTLFERQFQAR